MTPFRIQIGGYDVGDAPTPWCIIAKLNGAERHADRGIKRLFRGVFIDWEKLSFTLFEPLLRLLSMAFGTRSVAAAVVTPERFAAIVASVQPPTQRSGAAGHDVSECSALGGHHHPTVL